MRTRSTVTDRIYEPDEMVFLVNPVQIARYLKHKATVYDMVESGGKLVVAFSKKETQLLYEQWLKREI